MENRGFHITTFNDAVSMRSWSISQPLVCAYEQMAGPPLASSRGSIAKSITQLKPLQGVWTVMARGWEALFQRMEVDIPLTLRIEEFGHRAAVTWSLDMEGIVEILGPEVCGRDRNLEGDHSRFTIATGMQILLGILVILREAAEIMSNLIMRLSTHHTRFPGVKITPNGPL